MFGLAVHHRLQSFIKHVKLMIICAQSHFVKITKSQLEIHLGKLNYLILSKGKKLRNLKDIQEELEVCHGPLACLLVGRVMEQLLLGI